MSIRQISQTPAGTTDFTDLKEEVTRNARGLNTISLSNYDADTAPVVKVGSVFENNNATFLVETADESPTGYSGVANSTTFYLYYDESGGAFIFSSTVPTWSDALQGYYNGNDRAFFSMYKDSGGTLYQNKAKMPRDSSAIVRTDDIMERTEGAGISLADALFPTTTTTDGSFSFSVTGTQVLSRGVYFIIHEEGDGSPPYSYIQMYSNGSWQIISTGNTSASQRTYGDFVFSDGTNFRVGFYTTGASGSVYYRKF